MSALSTPGPTERAPRAGGTDDGVIRAAGAVVWRLPDGGGRAHDPASAWPPGLEVAVVHRPRYDDWSLPKGKQEPGEHPLLTAAREVREETGLRVRLGRRLPTARYQASGRPKRVRYWAAEAVGDGGFTPGDEVDGLRWLPPAEADRLLSYPWDRRVLAALRAAPPRTTPVLLLRHARAEPRGSRPAEADWSRPLDPDGLRQAAALADLLGLYGTLPVLTSNATRCVQTVLPYARAHGVQAAQEPALSEEGFGADADGARALARRVVRAGAGGIVCSHRPVLPALIGEALSGPGAPAGNGAAAVPKRRLARGEFLAVHLRDGVVVALDRSGPAPHRGSTPTPPEPAV